MVFKTQGEKDPSLKTIDNDWVIDYEWAQDLDSEGL